MDKSSSITSSTNYSQFRIIIITFILSFSIFTTLTGEGIVIPVFPLYLETFGAGAFQLGLLIGVFSLTSLLLSPVIGSLADRYGRKLFIIFGLLAFAIANILYIQARSFNELLFFRIIEGSTAACIGPIVNAMLIDIIPENQRGKYLGLANGSSFMGLIVGPALGGFLIQDGNYAFPFEVSALVALLGMFLAIFILPNDYSKFKNLKKEKTTITTPFHEKINFNNWLIGGTTIIFIIIMFIRFAGMVSWTLIEPSVSFFLYSQNYSSLEVGLYFSCYGITMFIGQTTLGGLSDRFGRKLILQIGLGTYLLGFLFLLNTTQITNFYISGALNGIGLSLVIPSVVALLADITNNETNRGKVMGIYYGIFFLAGIVGPIFGGYLGDVFSFNFVLYVSVLILSLGLLSSFRIQTNHGTKVNVLDEKASPAV